MTPEELTDGLQILIEAHSLETSQENEWVLGDGKLPAIVARYLIQESSPLELGALRK